MARYRVPFGEVNTEDTPSRFDPGPVLARIVDEGLLELGPKGTVEGTVSTPWGELGAERRGEMEVLVETPTAEVTARQVLLNVAAMKLGIEKRRVESSGGTIQEVDVGERVLVCPHASGDAVRQAPKSAKPGEVAGVDAESGIVYGVTQESPYVKILGRTWGPVAPMTALSAAAMHLVLSEGFRPTYPRTRVVAHLVDRGEEACEVTVQAHKAGDGPAVERVLVGGEVEPLDK